MALQFFTVRGGFYDAAAWDPAGIVKLFAAELQKLGMGAPQLPTVAYPPLEVRLSVEPPMRTLTAVPPAPFEPVSQSRDTRVPYADDPAKLAEYGQAVLTVFTWNVCAQPEQAGALRDLFRRLKPDGALKLSPIVKPWTEAPPELPGFPPKAAQSSCEPRGGGGGPAVILGIFAALGALVAFLRRR